jgi:DNA-binding IclR family transcriptional regulator
MQGGETAAALTISCPRERFTPALKGRCVALVIEGAQTLSRTLGYAP